MKRFLALLLVPAIALSAPVPKPPIPTAVAVTQGLVTRTLQITSSSCIRYVATPVNGPHGQTRFNLLCNNGTAQGSWVAFENDAGPITPTYLWPATTCGQKPAPVILFFECPFGTHGNGFNETHDWTCVNGVWQATAWVPTWTPPAPPTPPPGVCTPNGGPSWQAPRYVGADAVPAKPAKGASFTGPYGLTTTRVTDHTVDAPGQPWIVSWYNRFQAFNADNSLFLAYEADGFWLVFDARTLAVVRKLQGPAADAELQWDVAHPHIARFLPTNGGRVLKKIDVTTGAVTVDWDFTAAVGAIFPNATRYWTKSEGSPTADGRYWCLMAEDDGFHAVYGFVKLDIVNHVVAWSMGNPAGTDIPDNVGCTPSGRWFVDAGTTSRPTMAYATDGSGLPPRMLSHKVEHGELGRRTDGHDFYFGPDFSSGSPGEGWMFTVDIDTGVRTNLLQIYENQVLGNSPGNCPNCGVHPSAKAFHKPGWAVASFYGAAPSNILLFNVEDGRVLGLGADYANVPTSSYWPEPHCTVDRDLMFLLCSDNLKNMTTPLDVDIYRTALPALPQ